MKAEEWHCQQISVKSPNFNNEALNYPLAEGLHPFFLAKILVDDELTPQQIKSPPGQWAIENGHCLRPIRIARTPTASTPN